MGTIYFASFCPVCLFVLASLAGFVKSTSTDLAGEFLTWSLRVGHTPNDKFLAVVMSNGPFDGLHQKLVSAWQKS